MLCIDMMHRDLEMLVLIPQLLLQLWMCFLTLSSQEKLTSRRYLLVSASILKADDTYAALITKLAEGPTIQYSIIHVLLTRQSRA